MPIQDEQQRRREQDAIDAARDKEREAEQQRAAQSAPTADTKSDKLLPILNATRDRCTSRIESLNAKKTTRQGKIANNAAKISRLSTKAERLSVTNEMLHRLTAGTRLEAAANAIIEQNQRRIDKIRNTSIPRFEQKIAGHQARIAQLDKRIAAQQRKIDKCTALSNVITSFVIMNPEKRRAQFSQNMDVLHRVTTETLQAKLEKCNTRHDALLVKLQDEKITHAQAVRIGEQIAKNNERIKGITQKLSVLTAVKQPYAEQSAEKQDAVIAATEQQLDSAAQRGDMRINPLTETICMGAAERVIDREAIQAEAADLVAAMSKAEKAAFIRENGPLLFDNATKPAVIAAYSLILAEHVAQGQQLDDIRQAATTRVAAMTIEEKHEFLNHPLNQSTPPVEIAMNGFIRAEMHEQQQQREAIQQAAAARVAVMSPDEKREFMNRADSDRLHTPSPVEIAMHDIINAEERAAAQVHAATEQAAPIPTEQQPSMIVTVEHNSEIRFYQANPGVSAQDILKAAAQDHPMVAMESFGTRLSPEAFAEMEQSAKLGTSIAVNGDQQIASVMEVNGGKGGLADQERTPQNTRVQTVVLSPSRAQDEYTKINPEYFKSIPKSDRQIALMPSDAAKQVMETLKQQGIPFSAVVRDHNLTSVTVNKAQHGAVFLNALHAAGQRIPQEQERIQQATQDKTIRTPEAAAKISAALDKAGIAHRSVQHDQGTIILTNPQDREKVNAVISATEQHHRRQFINPEVYAEMPREERFTQRMPEDQARTAVDQLAAQGVPHSAVLDGDRSAVTVSQKSKGFVLNRHKRAEIAGKAAQAQHKSEKTNAPAQQQDISD